ncbi:MAG: hypothetical protein IPP31_01630 [Chitinophagaceae bacterium]|nr:hypothetical protein [Chitinophagaceae bacterium]
MKWNGLTLLIALLTLLLVSCNTPRYVYSPAAQNVPVLTQKGDSKIGGYYSTNFVGEEKRNGETIDNRSRGYDLHGAVAITDHFAIQAGHFYRWEKTTESTDSATVRYKRNLTEFGLGYYLPINVQKSVFFQVFAGAGFGRFSFTDIDRIAANFHQANITKIYIQPAILFRSKGSFSSSVSIRASIMNYSKIQTSYNPSQLDDYNLDSLNNRAKIFFEPGFTGSFGFKNVPGLRFEFQGGLSFLASRKFIDYRLINLSFGTWFDLGSVFRKSKP